MPVGPALKWVRIRKEVFVTSVGAGNTLDPMNPPPPGYQPSSPRTYVVAADPSLRVQILDIGLACCSLEVGSAITTGLLVDSATVPSPDHGTTILLISGTVTDALAPAVLRAWEQLPEPKAAVSFGACANTGGPYWDAPSVTKGVDQLVPVSVYIPGCPPRPEALIAGLRQLRDEITVN